MLRAMRRPSATARGSIENWSLSRTMSPTPLVIWLPEPIATAIRACFSAGTSLTPSPIIAVKRPRSESAPTSAFFCSGVIRQKTVFCSARLREAGPVVGQLRPLDHAGVARDADRVGDRGHRRARVAGDQLQVDLLLAHELDRLARVRAQALLEHDQGDRLEPRRRRARRDPAGGAPAASPNATTRRPARVCSSSVFCSAGGRVSAPAAGEHVGRSEHVGARRRPGRRA